MWSFPINPSNENSIPIATEVEPTACERECSSQQKALVTCVDSIRAARDNEDGGESTADSPECLPMAVAAWTKCCEEANVREKEKSSAS
mmetsp:Transcript_233/g.471  ORF Transcript_233/g.471 Transcript_233/m.471 type:complete len:89 (+) Transcript_233:39-305(+)|eukprot:CAMPEP_0183707340 /NCGR_PEP_ID=MMETSP0737-20130205/3946_1 /TAXON_ID=385413 /ORGANISM="Thalassiosira miniscula, Strain CCMP1093" /LENGTH=88 /DNA_ID=CAMNT_0025934979 /DNA_START=26 /DNA_END=292 /DNA_ORIENTATION=-